MNLAKWLYRGGRPNWLASVANRCSAAVHRLGIAPNYLVALEVRGRRSGRTVSLPLVMAVVSGERYLVSMLGPDANWVRNAKAAGRHVTLRHGRREQVRLEEVPAEERAPILKAYLKRAPGARPHIAVDKDAPLSEFGRVAAQYLVFRVVPENTAVLNHLLFAHPPLRLVLVRGSALLNPLAERASGHIPRQQRTASSACNR